MSSPVSKQSPFAWSLILVLLGTAIHLVLGFITELSVDEAHYALYANHLAWSYFDHPPLVGWIQWPLVAINAPDGILRLIPITLWMISCLLVYQIADQLNTYCSNRSLFIKKADHNNPSFAGLAAANQGLTIDGGLTTSIEAGIGFDAITVALLGGSRAGGVVMAGLLFGAFKAGSSSMQVAGVSPEVLGVVKALIVLFIAAPPIIRALYRLPSPEPKVFAATQKAKAAKVIK